MCESCLYLNEGGRRCRPAFVQNTLGEVFTQVLEEGEAHVIQEIRILRAVILMTVDEAFNEPKKRDNVREEVYRTAHTKCSCKNTKNCAKVSVKHLRIKSAACRRLFALLRAFIPRHPDWITITKRTHTCIY